MAQLVQGHIDETLDVLDVGEIRLDRKRVAAVGDDLVRQFLGFLQLGVGDKADFGPLLAEPMADGVADA